MSDTFRYTKESKYTNDADVTATPLFDGVDSRIRAKITRDMLRTYQQGDSLCCEAETADHLYVIRRGRVCVSAGGETLVTRGPHEVIGEQAFVDQTARSATVTAIGQVDALRIPHTVVETLLNDPAFRHNLLRVLSGKLSESTRERAERFRRERLLFAEFRGHVSDEVAQRLLSSGLDYGKPRRVPAVILFSDIRGFTEASGRLSSEDIAIELSFYLDAVVDIVHSRGGLVDKFVGDAVMAVWGFEPAPADRLAIAALQCAKDMIRAASTRMFAGAPIRIGVGLNAGDVFMGNVGGKGKRQFTVLGSPVNLAARFETASKLLGAPIAMGEALAELLPQAELRRLTRHDGIEIKGAANQSVYTFSPSDADQEVGS